MIHLAHALLDRPAFAEFVNSSPWRNVEYAWIRWRNGAALALVREVERIEESASGRIFWSGGEVRWQRIESGVRMVYVGDQPYGHRGLSTFSTALNQRTTSFVVLQAIRNVSDGLRSLTTEGSKMLLCAERVEYATALGAFERFAGIAPREMSDLKLADHLEREALHAAW